MRYFTHPEDRDSAFFKVEGWVNKYMPEVVRFAVEMMKIYGVQPRSAGEIGVHHGRFFLVLEELCDEVGYCDAYDVFEDQFRNLDGSGCGSEKKFLANVEAYAKSSNRVRAFKVDSLDLCAGVSLFQRDTTYELFSIDGCHTALHTCSDLKFAERNVAPGGVVIVDDISNMSWMGVLEGVCRYLQGPSPRLAPFGVGLNKLLLTPVGNQSRYFEYFLDNRADLNVPAIEGAPQVTKYFGYSVFRYGY